MRKYPLVLKASGEKEVFNPNKLKASLHKSGADSKAIQYVLESVLDIMHEDMTTQEIYSKAFTILKRRKKGFAARYSLKKAIMELGPTGYPFEHFVAQVLRFQGFDIEVGQTLQGRCVTHEVDVIASHNHTQYLVECKFYNSQGKYANVRVPLYIRSRVNDIIEFREKLPQFRETRFHGWIVTNTRFTEDALNYGRCAGLHLVSWDYPEQHSLKEMIEKTGVFPITALTTLNKNHKAFLLKKELVLCRQITENPKVLEEAGLDKRKISLVLKELQDLGIKTT